MHIYRFPLYKLHPWRYAHLHWVQHLLGGGSVWLAGGALRTMLDPTEPVSDYDLFFKNEEGLRQTRQKIESDGWRLVFKCPKGELFTYKKFGIKLQCVAKRFYHDIEHLLDSFDFTVCQGATDGWHFYTTSSMIKSVKTKRLEVHLITYPVATINRLYKYRQKGYFVPEQTYVDLVMQIANRSFDGEELALYID